MSLFFTRAQVQRPPVPMCPPARDYDDDFTLIATAADSFRSANEFRRVISAITELRRYWTGIKGAATVDSDVRRLCDIADERTGALLIEDNTMFTKY